MSQDEHDLPVTLPEELRRQFAEVQRRLWRVETGIALGCALIALLISVLALFVSDRFWNTPPGLRFLFMLAGLAASVAAAFFWADRWVINKRSQKDLARLVQKKYRVLGDRLLGIVELAQEQRHLSNFSPELYHAAIEQVAGEARQYDFRQSVSVRPTRKIAFAAAIAAGCWIVLAVILPEASGNAFVRWAAPFARVPRYTLVELTGLPSEMIVPHGEPFVISGTVRYRSFWKPARASAAWLNLPKIIGPVQAGAIHLEIPGQVETGFVRVKVGDAEADVKVTPVQRPALRELSASIRLPDYLHYADQTQALQSGSLQAVEGSRITFHGKTSRALASAEMQPAGGDPRSLAVTNDSFVSAPAQPEGMADYLFNWRDDLGLSNAAPLRLSVVMQKDAAPLADLPGMPRESALLFSDVMHIRAEAGDDFGVRDLGLTWDVVSDTPAVEPYTSEVKIMTPAPTMKKAAHVFLWSPRNFNIQADSTVELQGFARDFFPDRERSRTPAYHIRILSQEEHAELIRGQLEDVMARIEEVTRTQEKIVANLREVKDDDKLADARKSERIGDSKNDQLENSSHLDELSERAASAMQEAMKNPLFTADTIRQWTQSAQQWQHLAEQKMKEAANAMQAAQQNSQSRQQQTADATEKAEDILKALEKMQQSANKHMDNLHALTLAQRLRKVGADEKNISGELIKSAPDTVGLPPGDLPDKLKAFEHTLATGQTHAQKESDTLQAEISRFFERTKRTNYGEVSKEMTDAHTSDEMERVGGMINDNIGILASSNLTLWSGRFDEWSHKLEPPPSSQSSQQSGTPSKKKDLTEQLIALLRLRENEMNLRDQTSLLDQQKGEPESFKTRANSLGDTQKKLNHDLDVVRQDVGLPELDATFQQTEELMTGAESILRKPETGKPADAAESQTVDAVTDLINLINEQGQQNSQQQQQSGQDGNSAEEMAFLMRLMQNTANAKAMALQPNGSLNANGGRTDRASSAAHGNASGKNAASRNVNKAAGVIENSPAEFRDALDNYFHGIEQNKD
jgi:hypothetical protein